MTGIERHWYEENEKELAVKREAWAKEKKRLSDLLVLAKAKQMEALNEIRVIERQLGVEDELERMKVQAQLGALFYGGGRYRPLPEFLPGLFDAGYTL